jgi:hypothetical protein
MRIAKWAAIVVTLLMGLANLGQVAQSNVPLKIVGPVLAVAAGIAVIGFASGRSWGARAVIAVGAANLVIAVVAAIAGLDGWPVAVVLSALAILLTALSAPRVGQMVSS